MSDEETLPPQSRVADDRNSAPLASYLRELSENAFFKDEKTYASFAYMVKYYRERASWARKMYRTFGVTLLIASTTLPFWTAYGKFIFGWTQEQKDVWISAISVAIAALSGAMAFFRWDVRWRGNTDALFGLESARGDWENARAAALCEPDQEKARSNIDKAMNTFHASVSATVRGELGEFFRAQSLPAVAGSEKRA